MELHRVKRKLNQAMPVGEAVQGASSICCAALIKAYLRELPADPWLHVREHLEASLHEVDGALPPAHLLRYLPERESALLYWLCDAMAQARPMPRGMQDAGHYNAPYQYY